MCIILSVLERNLHKVLFYVYPIYQRPPPPTLKLVQAILYVYHIYEPHIYAWTVFLLPDLCLTNLYVCASHSVKTDSLQLLGLWPGKLLCLCDSPGKNIGVGYIPFSKISSWSRDRTPVSCIGMMSSINDLDVLFKGCTFSFRIILK